MLKRFFRLHDNVTVRDVSVSVRDNNTQMQAELSRLEMGKWFLKAFFLHARNRGVIVDQSKSPP